MQRNFWLAVLSRTMLSVLLLAPMATSAGAQGAPQQPPLKEVTLAADTYTLGDPAPEWAEIVPLPDAMSTQRTANRLADRQYFLDGIPSFFVRQALHINDVTSLGTAGQLPIEFVPDYQQLRVHWVRIHRGAETLDQTRSATIRFLQRETGLEHGIYSGVVTALIVLSDLRVGDTVECSYSVKGRNPVFGNKFLDFAGWDSTYPTALRRVIVKAPATRKINWRVLGDDPSKPLTPQETVEDGFRRLAFEQMSITETSPEPLTPPDINAFRTIQFSEFSGWEEVVDWASRLFQTTELLTGELRGVVNRLQDKTAEERVVGALEFVQSQIRYFSVSLGESSHRPAPPNVVATHRYGDCKDKTFLLIGLLKELGVDSRPVLLRSGSRNWIGKVLPSPTAFDHVIAQVNVDGQVYYLDPTRMGQHGRLSRMGQVHEGTQVLVIAPETRGPTTIKTPNAADLAYNEVTETATLSKLAPEGQLQVRQVWNGKAAEGIRVGRGFLAPEQLKRSLSNGMEMRYAGARLNGEPVFEDDTVNNVVTLTMLFDVPSLATEKDGDWYIRFAPTNMRGVMQLASTAGRKTPLAIPHFPLRAKYSFEARFPDAVSVVRDPAATTVENKYFTYTVTSTFRGNIGKAVIDLELREDEVPVQDLPKYVRDVRSISEASTSAIVVTKGDIRSNDAAAGGFAAIIRARLQETAERAVEDFEKAAKLDDKEGQLYADLWLSWTLQRLNRPIPDAIATRAKAEAKGDWPRPALAMLAGGLTPEALLDCVRAKTGDEQAMALAEGYFYIGQHYFARGDKDNARAFFEKTRQMEVLPYLEHIAAGFELQRLGAGR